MYWLLSHVTESNTSPPHPIHPNELHLQKNELVISLKLQQHSYMRRPSHPDSGVFLLSTLSTSSIIFQPLTLIINPHSKDYIENHQITTPYRFFFCLCYPWLKHTQKIKLNQNLLYVAILDSHYPIIVTSVLTQFLQRCTYPDMCDLLRLLLHLRHCSPTLPFNQLTWNGQKQQCHVL